MLDRKDIVMIVTACVTLASGIALSFLSFFLSLEHVVHNSVLWYFAQTLLYAALCFGLVSYVHLKINDVTIQINRELKKKKENGTGEKLHA